jgi:LmbE family N-acetylglucosaminyl deacetylase
MALAVLLAAVGLSACGSQRDDLPVLPSPRPEDRILIVAPHIDDESIAVAGYASDALAAGAQVFVIYMTAGDGGRIPAELGDRTLLPRPGDFLHEGHVRIAEAYAAMARLGVPQANVFVLGYPDGDLERMMSHPEKVITSRKTRDAAVPYGVALSPGAPYRVSSVEADLERVLETASPTRIIAPSVLDAHPDHRSTAILVWARLAGLSKRPALLSYLVHFAFFPEPFRLAPRRWLLPPPGLKGLAWRSYPLSAATRTRKQAVLRIYKSQRRDPYLRLLIDAFVRRNELFLEEAPRTGAPPQAAAKERLRLWKA